MAVIPAQNFGDLVEYQATIPLGEIDEGSTQNFIGLVQISLLDDNDYELELMDNSICMYYLEFSYENKK